MSENVVRPKVRRAELDAVVTRADGTVERLGVVSFYDRNPLKRLWWRLARKVG